MPVDMPGGSGGEVMRLRRQVEVMLAHALDRGLTPTPPPWIFEAALERRPLLPADEEAGWAAATSAWEQSETADLVRAHRELARLVAPARPASLVILDDHRRASRVARVPGRDVVRALPRARVSSDGQSEPMVIGLSGPPERAPRTPAAGIPAKSSRSPFGIGPRAAVPSSTLPVVRRLVVATGILLSVFVLLAAVPTARDATLGEVADFAVGGARRSFGELLLRELFLLCAAGLGAAFTALFSVNREIARGTYDPDLDLAVLQRLLVGMTCGLVLAELLPVREIGAGHGMASIAVPAVALVGGFCASMVIRILTRLVSAVESLFNSDPDEQDELRRQIEAKRAEEAVSQVERAMLARLLDIRRVAAAGAPSRTVVDEIDRMVTEVAHV